MLAKTRKQNQLLKVSTWFYLQCGEDSMFQVMVKE